MRTGQCGSHGLQLNTVSQRKGQARITVAKQNPEFSEVRLTLSGISESDPRSTSLYFSGQLAGPEQQRVKPESVPHLGVRAGRNMYHVRPSHGTTVTAHHCGRYYKASMPYTALNIRPPQGASTRGKPTEV